MGDNQSMAKEQIIYLLPEEELTNVRERLENTHAKRIMLVIPPQTQLRSHVVWRLLHSRIRELGLDVLVISSDRQIRAVAQAAGFRVTDSSESPPSDRPRPMNRPVRSDMSGKSSQGKKKQSSSGNKDTRPLQPDQQQMPPTSSKNGSALSSSVDMNREFDTAASSTFEIEDVPYDVHYELPIETVPPPRSGAGDQEDAEVDPLVVDYYVARSIREAAQSSESDEVSSSIENAETSGSKLEQSSKIPQPSGIEDDPFAYMEDIQPIASPEQQASTSIDDIDHGIPDISDVPTDVHDVEVEDLGDEREVMLQHDVSPQSNRTGNTVRPSLDDFGDEDDLLPKSIPISDHPTRITPSPAARVSTPSTTARREPQPIIQPSPQSRNVSIDPTLQQTKKPITTKSSRVVTTPHEKHEQLPTPIFLPSQEDLETVIKQRIEELYSTGVHLDKIAKSLSVRAMAVKTLLIFLGVLVASIEIAMQLFGIPHNDTIVIYLFIGVLIATWAGLEAAFKWESRSNELKNLAANCRNERRKLESAIRKADTTPDRESFIDALDKQLAEAQEKAAALGVNVVLEID
jgi:hypothetical protein